MKQSGSIDVWVEIYKPVETANDVGQIRRTYELHASDWAERNDLVTVKDNERVLNTTHRVAFGITQFRFRYRTDFNAKMMIKDGETWFEVVGLPLMEGRNHWILLNCEQRDDIPDRT